MRKRIAILLAVALLMPVVGTATDADGDGHDHAHPCPHGVIGHCSAITPDPINLPPLAMGKPGRQSTIRVPLSLVAQELPPPRR